MDKEIKDSIQNLQIFLCSERGKLQIYGKSWVLPAALEPVPAELRQPVKGQVQDPETKVLVI